MIEPKILVATLRRAESKIDLTVVGIGPVLHTQDYIQCLSSFSVHLVLVVVVQCGDRLVLYSTTPDVASTPITVLITAIATAVSTPYNHRYCS